MKVFQKYDCIFFVSEVAVLAFEAELAKTSQQDTLTLVRLSDYVFSANGSVIVKARYPLAHLIAIALPLYLNCELRYENQKVQRLLVRPLQSLNNPAQLSFDFG